MGLNSSLRLTLKKRHFIPNIKALYCREKKQSEAQRGLTNNIEIKASADAFLKKTVNKTQCKYFPKAILHHAAVDRFKFRFSGPTVFCQSGFFPFLDEIL
jgi:hypothetical protein